MLNRLCAASALVLGVLGLTACETNNVAVTGVFPAKSQEAADLRTIAVLDFAGRDGPAFANDLRSELQNATLDSERYFTLVSDDQLLSRAGVRSFSGSSQQLSAALDFGRRAGVEAVYIGEVAAADATRNSAREEHSRCTEWDGLFDCETREKYMTTCHDLAAQYGVSVQVVNVATGTLAHSETVSSQQSDRYCDDEDTVVDPNQLIATARADAATQVRRAVAPYNAVMQVKLKTEAPDLAEPAAVAFQNGVAFAQAGRMDRACAIWAELAPGGSSTSVPVLYNLGVCAESSGDFDRAITLYTTADSLLMQPDSVVEQARQRALGQRTARQMTN